MRVYEQITAGIGKKSAKSAHIIGGEIGGLSAAAFLVDDAHIALSVADSPSAMMAALYLSGRY